MFTENPVDLVILDMIMPGMKGEEVLQALRSISPDVPVVVSSGFMSEEQRDRLKEFGIEDFLDKPYRDQDVINSVTKILSRGRSAANPAGAVRFVKSAVKPETVSRVSH